jgi:hypothetical protein
MGAQVSGQCLYTGTITWNTTVNVNAAKVTYQDTTASGAETTLATSVKGSANTPFLVSGHHFIFKLYDMDNGQVLATQEADVPTITGCCNQNLCPPQGTLTFQMGAQVAGQCLYNGSITWNTTVNVNNARVTTQR